MRTNCDMFVELEPKVEKMMMRQLEREGKGCSKGALWIGYHVLIIKSAEVR